MATDRKNAGAGSADVAAHEEQIAQHLDREHAGTVLRQAHSVADYNRLSVAINVCGRFDLRTTQARARFDVSPLEVVHARHERIEAVRLFLDEVDIDYAFSARGL